MTETRTEVAERVLAGLTATKLITSRLRIDGDVVRTGSGSALLPTGGAKASWRRTVNASLLPRSVSSENRRQLLYAVLQDLVVPALLVRGDGTKAEPLAELDPRLAAFASVHHIPVGERVKAERRRILVPLHVSVPLAYDTYRRTAPLGGPDTESGTLKHQTDKGFRGAFLRFLSSNEFGECDPSAMESLKRIFGGTAGLSMLDRLMVAGVTRHLKTKWRPDVSLRDHLKPDDVATAARPAPDELAGWGKVFAPSPPGDRFKALPTFVEQGRRLASDLAAVAAADRLGRLTRVAAVETVLGYHFSLYLVRLVNALYEELARIEPMLQTSSTSPWRGRVAQIRFRDRRQRLGPEWADDYEVTMRMLNEAYLLLPVLNAIEVAIRAASGESRAGMQDLQWADVRGRELDPRSKAIAADLLRFWTAMAYEDCGEKPRAAALREQPVTALSEALRFHYTQPEQVRFPREHHQLVFEQTALQGPGSFRQVRPRKHFAMGQDLLQLLVFVLFRPERGERRVPLMRLEQRLRDDLIVPADDHARDSLVESLRSLGLLDRLSDVGEAQFLRCPSSV